jgi:hypothetical protein
LYLIKVAKVNKELAFVPKDARHYYPANGLALPEDKSNPDFWDSGISGQNFILRALKLHKQKRGYSFAPEIF